MSEPEINLYNGDCMEAMKAMPDNAYDLAFTDPPYNVGRKYDTYDDNRESEEYYNWCRNWFTELYRISDTIVMTIGYKNLPFWFSMQPKHQIIWYKPNQNSPSPIGGFNAYESILIWGKTQKRIGHDIFTKNIAMQKELTWHTCPKHLDSWKAILNMIIDAPAKIIDPFLGSGTTAIACNDLGLDLDAFEIDDNYYREGVKRFERHKSQLKLAI